jgi:hypothetical protein
LVGRVNRDELIGLEAFSIVIQRVGFANCNYSLEVSDSESLDVGYNNVSFFAFVDRRSSICIRASELELLGVVTLFTAATVKEHCSSIGTFHAKGDAQQGC